jgi:hypothetical protein
VLDCALVTMQPGWQVVDRRSGMRKGDVVLLACHRWHEDIPRCVPDI